eukprot:7321457-Lingulodinium_polyedra.AAC.1
MAIIYVAFYRHGLRINMGRGKTEALIKLAGPGARRAKQEVLGTGYLTFPTPYQGDLKLIINHAYKHMGCISRPDCAMQVEFRRRAR